MLLWFYFIQRPCQEDAFPLAGCFRFDYKSFIFLICDLMLQLLIVSWQHVRLREVVVLMREPALHSHEMSSETIFTGEIIHSREMISSLMRPHPLQQFYGDRTIKPSYVPITLFILSEMIIVKGATHFLNYIILCESGIHYKPLLLVIIIVVVTIVL